jgi:hypothetical protein
VAIYTQIHLYTKDAQGVKGTLSFYVAPLAFAAAQTLPLQANIEALVSAIFGAANPSTSIVYAYSVEVLNKLDLGTELGGPGDSATVIAAKGRSGIGLVGNPGPSGLEGEEFKIPGLNKGAVTFLTTAPNVISTVGTTWDDIRTALVALGYRFPGATAYTSGEILEAATAFNGRRAAPRSR